MVVSRLSRPAENVRWLARYHGWLLFLVWALVQAGCWHYYRAPRLFGDGVSYVHYARQLAETGSFGEAGRYLRYAGYSAFLAVFFKLRLGLTAMALAQVGLSGLAACAFYSAAKRLGSHHWPTAALATLALVSWPEVQAFNAFILTESLFTSLLIFSLWAVARIRDAGSFGAAVMLLLLTLFVRPNGFIALGGAALAGLVWLRQVRPGWVRWAGLLAGALLPLAWAGINWLLATIHIMEGYAAGTVIFNYPASALPVPATLQLPPPTASSLAQLLWFISHNFRYFSQLASMRLTYFMGFPKPWHSGKHIIWASLTLPVVYWFAACGMGQRLAALPVRVYLAACLLLQASMAMLTFEDWDVRFSGPLIPYWLMLAALGAQPLLRRGATPEQLSW